MGGLLFRGDHLENTTSHTHANPHGQIGVNMVMFELATHRAMEKKTGRPLINETISARFSLMS